MRNDGKTYCLDTGNTNAVEIIKGNLKFGRTEEAKKIRSENMKKGFDHNPYSEKEIIGVDYEKANAITTGLTRDNLIIEKDEANSRIRRLTPIECERLQTVKDGYTNHVSDSQRYKMLGNGWNIDTIVHILSYLKQL